MGRSINPLNFGAVLPYVLMHYLRLGSLDNPEGKTPSCASPGLCIYSRREQKDALGAFAALVKENPFIVQGISLASLLLTFFLLASLIANNMFSNPFPHFSDNLYADQISRTLQLPRVLSNVYVLVVCLK